MIAPEVFILFLHQRRQNPVMLAAKLGLDRYAVLRWLMAGGQLSSEDLSKLYDWACVQVEGTK